MDSVMPEPDVAWDETHRGPRSHDALARRMLAYWLEDESRGHRVLGSDQSAEQSSVG